MLKCTGATNAFKTASKITVQKIVEVTADKVTKVLITWLQIISEQLQIKKKI